mmetsp:Transcript_20751/g.49437  ORF Transcript_20751/g.49437 Transcript_20751/m.49437 type:complete len:293 (+) Transcript_20751:147-1025(+)
MRRDAAGGGGQRMRLSEKLVGPGEVPGANPLRESVGRGRRGRGWRRAGGRSLELVLGGRRRAALPRPGRRRGRPLHPVPLRLGQGRHEDVAPRVEAGAGRGVALLGEALVDGEPLLAEGLRAAVRDEEADGLCVHPPILGLLPRQLCRCVLQRLRQRGPRVGGRAREAVDERVERGHAPEGGVGDARHQPDAVGVLVQPWEDAPRGVLSIERHRPSAAPPVEPQVRERPHALLRGGLRVRRGVQRPEPHVLLGAQRRRQQLEVGPEPAARLVPGDVELNNRINCFVLHRVHE